MYYLIAQTLLSLLIFVVLLRHLHERLKNCGVWAIVHDETGKPCLAPTVTTHDLTRKYGSRAGQVGAAMAIALVPYLGLGALGLSSILCLALGAFVISAIGTAISDAYFASAKPPHVSGGDGFLLVFESGYLVLRRTRRY